MSSSSKQSDHKNGVKADGALPFLHPTHIESDGRIWRSRANRKGRHPLKQSQSDAVSTPSPTNRFGEVMAGIGRMATQWLYWDISWLVGVGFVSITSTFESLLGLNSFENLDSRFGGVVYQWFLCMAPPSTPKYRIRNREKCSWDNGFHRCYDLRDL